MSSSLGTGGEPGKPDREADVRVLGRLMLVQSTLHVMPSAGTIADFVGAGLLQVPGVRDVVVEIDAEAISGAPGSSAARNGRRASLGAPPGGGRPEPRPEAEAGGAIERLPFRVLDRSYGSAILTLDRLADFEPYRPHVQNLANVAAVAIESREQRAFLERMAASLREQVAETETARQALVEAQRMLEARVRDRTADLQRTNVALGAEVEDRRVAEAALRESEERLRMAQRAAKIGIWDMDLDSGSVRWFEGQAGLFGLGSDLRGLHIDEVRGRIHPDDRAGTVEATARAIEHGGDFDAEFRVVWDDGSVHWLASKGRVLPTDDGIPRRMLGVNMDVTARRQLEEHLLHAQKMESIGRLAGGVAHDFNNLLTAILGYADMALVAVPPEGEIAGCLREIRDAGQRATHLTQQLLAFARRQVICPQTVDLNGLVLELSNMLRRLIGEHVELVTMTGASPALVKVDPGQFTQILMNLAVNARDAMPGGGCLRVSTRSESPGSTQPGKPEDRGPGGWVVLEVSDTGTGMTPETKARVFEPFFTTKPAGQGTGLGLATCYGIVEQSGGRIRVTSELGRGSTFTIHLPRAEDAASPAEVQGPADAVPGGHESVLVAEDDEGLRNLAVRTLRALGYEVIAAADGLEALECLAGREAGVDLLVTDVVMPRLGGIELVQRLAERGVRCPVLFVSGYSALESLAGVLGRTRRFLQKPFTSAALRCAARELLDLEPQP